MLKMEWPAAEKRRAEQRPKPQNRPLHEATASERSRYLTGYIITAAVIALVVSMFFIGRATVIGKATAIADAPVKEATEAQNLASAFKTDRDSIEASMTALESRMDDLESDLTSTTRAAELWEARALDASSTAASVQADNEALKRDIARIQQQKRTVPASSSVKQASSTTSSTAGWQTAKASWYGPGFYGRKTASGAVLTTGMMNVAHKTLAFGTRIEFCYNGRTVTAVVNDRGPFVAGRTFDLGPGTAQALGFSGVGTVEWRVV